jgi:hypothetical protein
MDCLKIDEMMSLQLDGLLAPDEERQFLAHVSHCATCSPVWTAMELADSLLSASAREPLPVPADFTIRVMEKIAVSSVQRTALQYGPAEAVGPAVVLPSVLPPQFANGDNTLFIPDLNLQELQHRLGNYVRGVAAVALSLAASFGLLLALLVSGAIQPGAALAPTVDTLRTFFGSLDTWARSFVGGSTSQLVALAGIVMALMALAAWQIVHNYHRAAEAPYDVFVPEAA